VGFPPVLEDKVRDNWSRLYPTVAEKGRSDVLLNWVKKQRTTNAARPPVSAAATCVLQLRGVVIERSRAFDDSVTP
jgi:hypothetical protein